MKINVKHIVEIAGGLVLGKLASEAVNGIAKIVKGAVIKIKDDRSKKA